MNLSDNFTLEELTASQTAVRKGINNEPSEIVISNLKKLAAALEQVRTVLGGNAINISSGYRSPKLNLAIGGVATSAHVYGYAADFTCPKYGTPRQVVDKLVQSGIKFDQLIIEGVTVTNPNGAWVHISVDPKMRQQVLNATFVNGKALYTTESK